MFWLKVALNQGPTPDFLEMELNTSDRVDASKTAEYIAKEGCWHKDTFYPSSSIASVTLVPPKS